MTKYAHLMLVLSLYLSLIGCSSNSNVVNYYMLDTPQARALPAPQAKLVKIAPIKLAEYLQQPNLAIQVGANQIYFSPLDVWADPLQQGISKALIKALNLKDQQHHYVSAQSPQSLWAQTTISVRIDHFHPTDNSQVIMDGIFWLQQNEQQPRAAIPFSFNAPLEGDGYSHSVSKLHSLLQALADLMAQQLAQ